MPLVFVYGTLMRGRSNHAVLERLGAAFVAAATTRDERTLVDLGPYPALLPASATPTARIEGEVWDLPASALPELDAFEGSPDLYRREQIALETADAQTLEAFVYVLTGRPPPNARVLPSGRYEHAGTPLPHGAAGDLDLEESTALDNPPATEDGSKPQLPR